MQQHVGVLLLRPLRPVAFGICIGRDVERVQSHGPVDEPADIFCESGIDLAQNVLAIEQRPHLADGLVTDAGHDTADLVQHRLDRAAFGVPVIRRAR